MDSDSTFYQINMVLVTIIIIIITINVCKENVLANQNDYNSPALRFSYFFYDKNLTQSQNWLPQNNLFKPMELWWHLLSGGQ